MPGSSGSRSSEPLVIVLAVKPGHDGAVAAIEEDRLLFSVEAEKDSVRRHREIDVSTLLEAAEELGEAPDVIAVGGWMWAHNRPGVDYNGLDNVVEEQRRMFGKDVRFFSSSHERSHVAMALGMAPRNDSPQKAVLVWEGYLGHLYLIEGNYNVVKRIPVMEQPGGRWVFLFSLADETFPDRGRNPNVENAGKLMALAAYGDPGNADPAIAETIERIVGPGSRDDWHPAPKGDFKDSPVYNSGIESEATKTAAALLTDRTFEVFADAARKHLPAGIPLYISGGCGLNCDWNAKWRELGHFSSVFVPPCTDDSGSALGTAIDALALATGDPHIEWDVYSGREFKWDMEPDPAVWTRRRLDHAALAEAIAGGRVCAWVQGRWEIGPRALGNRSLLAEPFSAQTRDRLNEIKQREDYRPIAPICRIEDTGKLFDRDFEDPYMLYFRRVVSQDLGAVTHVDGSARVQTVSKDTNPRIHDLLSAFAARTGVGVLCNTSLNFKGFGFINRMSNLVPYCERRGVNDFVVGDSWFQREEA
jgi:hydroxymethyl cephem carbamoyltransferase